MKVSEFKQFMVDAAMENIRRLSEFLRHDRRGDKQLREELLPGYAFVRHRALDDNDDIEIGGEQETWDARLGAEILEVVQALPREEFEIRQSTATGSTTPYQYWKHSRDHLQFPQVIVDAIDRKHTQHYSDKRTLLVAFDGDYSQEDDATIQRWIEVVRANTHKGNFEHILLVERARLKTFELF